MENRTGLKSDVECSEEGLHACVCVCVASFDALDHGRGTGVDAICYQISDSSEAKCTFQQEKKILDAVCCVSASGLMICWMVKENYRVII